MDVVRHHNASPNAAECSLVNLLFLAVGGGAQGSAQGSGQGACLLDPRTTNLSDVTDGEWAEILTDVVADMQESNPAEVLLSAVPPGKRTKVQARFGEAYGKFWAEVAGAALEEGLGARAEKEKGNEFGKAGRGGGGTASRLDVERVRDLIVRITEVS